MLHPPGDYELDPAAVRPPHFHLIRWSYPCSPMCVIPFGWLGAKRLHNSLNCCTTGQGPRCVYNSEFVTASVSDRRLHVVNAKVPVHNHTMHEIITLQLGQQSNYLATHFWNAQVWNHAHG